MNLDETFTCEICGETYLSPKSALYCEERCARDELDNRRIYRGTN